MNKGKKFLKNFIGDVSNIQWRDLDHKKVYIAIAGVVVVVALIIVLLVSAFGGKTEKKPGDVKDTETVTEEADAQEANENPLELDAYESVNDLVFKYFYGLSMGDIPMVEAVVDEITEEEIQTIERKKDYVEAYKNIQCYTKKGLEEGTYVVFASYEMKIHNIETPAPGIMALYVCTGADGELYIFNGEAPDELTNYVLELAAEEEVEAVIADVDARYQQLVAEDEDLGKFAQTMLESQQEETTQETEETEEPEVPVEEETAQQTELEEPIETKVTDGIRLREERSTECRTLTTLANGKKVKVYANYEDGWSKISYDGMTGYCKTEYLESTEGVPTLGDNSSEETPEATEPEQPQEGAPAAQEETTTVNKKMKLTDTVRMRSERSTDSSIKTMIYENETVTVIESYSDGWSKVQKGDKTGYCKTEYLTEVN